MIHDGSFRKMNKTVKGLVMYVSKQVLTTLNTVAKHKIKEVLECLQIRYGRTRLEKLEQLVSEWLKFNDDDYDDKDDLLQAMKELWKRKEELNLVDKESLLM